ncbi:MAG: serine protease [Geobacteraceae bacterium GWC2_58_44]|nr:MAG: serine protease [Geobacteraceae bacterium GWC2_58_44]
MLIKGIRSGFCVAIILIATAAGAAGAAPGNLARQVLAETNLARTQPARYAGYLRDMRPLFIGKAYRLPGSVAMVMTSEGVAALDEAIGYLSKQAPLPPLAWSQGLAEAAADLVRDQGQTGQVGHEGGRSGGMQARIERHGTWTGRIAENIGYGPGTARLMVIELIVDDGVPGRGHRKNTFTRAFSVAGAACGPHPLYRHMCVMDFATQYKTRSKR